MPEDIAQRNSNNAIFNNETGSRRQSRFQDLWLPGRNKRAVPGDDGAFELEGPAAPAERGSEQSQAELFAEPLTSTNGLFIRLALRDGNTTSWERVIRADSEQDIGDACQDLAAAMGKSLQAVEPVVAQAILEQRTRWLNSQMQQKGQDDFLAGAIDSATFAKAQYFRDWLVKKLLVRGQPVIIGGPHKALKTSVVVDLAISVGSGRDFLGKFEVLERQRVLVMSGESGEATLQETAVRICQTKGIQLQQCDILWNFALPQLTQEQEVERLGAFVGEREVKVVIIDPLYLSMHGLDLSAANFFEVGPLLRGVTKVCVEAAATPILVHHTGKLAGMQKASTGDPIDLPDLAYAGFAEFARQWMLLSRRKHYEAGTGSHKLWLNVGGSSGQGGLWGVNVSEGVLNEQFGGRNWRVEVLSADMARTEMAQEQVLKRTQKKDNRKAEAHRGVLDVLISRREGETLTQLAELTAFSRDLVGEVIRELKDRGEIVPVKIKKPGGRGLREHDGWKIDPDGSTAALNKDMLDNPPPARRAAWLRMFKPTQEALPTVEVAGQVGGQVVEKEPGLPGGGQGDKDGQDGRDDPNGPPNSGPSGPSQPSPREG